MEELLTKKEAQIEHKQTPGTLANGSMKGKNQLATS